MLMDGWVPCMVRHCEKEIAKMQESVATCIKNRPKTDGELSEIKLYSCIG